MSEYVGDTTKALIKMSTHKPPAYPPYSFEIVTRPK